jgi:S1-C subfamily serine protease
MVTRLLCTLPLSLSVLFLGSLPAAHADNVLEQMQNEVAAIVRANKGGIVSIEDEGAMPPEHRIGANSDPRWIAEQQALFHHLSALQAQENGVSVQLSKAMLLYKAEHPKVIALKREKQTVEEEVQKLSAEMAKQQQSGRRGMSPFDRMNAPKSGSGFSIGNGYVVTTADVVEGMKRPLVIADDGTRMRAKLVGIDTELNLGLLQLPAKAGLSALKMGDSDTVEPGHFAIAIGNQAGHASSVALTMVSGFRKEGTFTGERFYPALIQIAGTIGVGTSGAPILNARGEVVGVIAGVPAGEWTETQIFSEQALTLPPGMPGGIFPPHTTDKPNPQPEPHTQSSPSGQAQSGVPFAFGQGRIPTPPNGMSGTRIFLRPPVTGSGFAIPINDLQFSIKELMANGKIVHAWIGVDLRPDHKTDDNADIIKVIRYIRIRGVYPDSPAQKGGLQAGDILTELNAKPVASMSEVRAAFMRLHPNDKLAVTVQRNGMIQTLNLTIEARPDKIVPPNFQPTRRPQ